MHSIISSLSWKLMPLKRAAVLSVTACSLLGVNVAAQQPDDDEPLWGLGLAVITSDKPYTGIDRDNMVLPMLSYENRYIRLSGPELAFKLPGYQFSDSNSLNFSVITKYDFTGYEQDDALILNGMEDRDGGFWAGGKAEWQNGVADISAEVLTEVAGDSEGRVVNFGIERTWHFAEQYMFTPRIVVSLLDKKYVDYYYGVSVAEITDQRAYYKGEAGVNVEMGARLGYMFNQKHFIFLDASVTSLASEIKDSPLVDRSTENRVFLGYMYSF